MFVGTAPLNASQWYRCALLAALTLPMGAVMRLIPIRENEADFASNSVTRSRRKTQTDGTMTLTFTIWMLLILNIPYFAWMEFSPDLLH